LEKADFQQVGVMHFASLNPRMKRDLKDPFIREVTRTEF